jgi:TRAP-type C4-dicarboxylate transport system permease small subunit
MKLRALVSLHNRLADWAAVLGGVGVALTASIYVAEIVARYFMRAPLNFSADLGSYMLCACVFLCLPAITRERRHIAIDFVIEHLPPRARPYYLWILWLITAAVLGAGAYFVAVEAIRQFEQQVLTTMALQIPRWWLSALACFGLASSAIHFVTPPSGQAEELGR